MKSLILNNPITAFTAHWRDYLEITKPKVVLLLVFSFFRVAWYWTGGVIGCGNKSCHRPA